MALGLPVVSLDRGGPAAMGGTVVSVGRTTEVARGLADAVRRTADTTPAAAPYLARRRAELLDLLRSRGLLPHEPAS
jgi:hypothetical protein